MASVSTMFGEELAGDVLIWRKDVTGPVAGVIHDYRTDDNGGIILLHVRRPREGKADQRLAIPWHNVSTIMPAEPAPKQEEQR